MGEVGPLKPRPWPFSPVGKEHVVGSLHVHCIPIALHFSSASLSETDPVSTHSCSVMVFRDAVQR